MILREEFEKYMREQFPMITRDMAHWEFAELMWFGGAIQASTMVPLALASDLEAYQTQLRARLKRGEFDGAAGVVH